MTSTSKIEKHDLLLPNKDDAERLAFVLLNVFTPEECQQWIELSESRGYSPALINIGTQQTLLTEVRNNSRCMIDDINMADQIFQRIKSYLPNVWKNSLLIGLNERLRFLRYDPGEKFVRHMDGSYRREDGSLERSYITVQLYLNEGFQGGDTTFVHYWNSDKDIPCVPRTGMVLIFEHQIYHEGSELKQGRKYAVRTDVMYRPIDPQAISDEDD